MQHKNDQCMSFVQLNTKIFDGGYKIMLNMKLYIDISY